MASKRHESSWQFGNFEYRRKGDPKVAFVGVFRL